MHYGAERKYRYQAWFWFPILLTPTRIRTTTIPITINWGVIWTLVIIERTIPPTSINTSPVPRVRSSRMIRFLHFMQSLIQGDNEECFSPLSPWVRGRSVPTISELCYSAKEKVLLSNSRSSLLPLYACMLILSEGKAYELGHIFLGGSGLVRRETADTRP